MRAPIPPSFVLSLRRTVCLGLLVPLFWAVQPGHAVAAANSDAANPEAATAPLMYDGLVPQPMPDAMPSATAWRDAHGAVAAFPRGHADILAWEARQGGPRQQPDAGKNPSPNPSHPHMNMHMQAPSRGGTP